MGHTPGPWGFENDTITSGYGDIARIHYQSCRGQSWRDDRSLIAAAPEMLQAVVDMIDSIDGECEFTMWDDGWQELYLRAKKLVDNVKGGA